MYTQEDMRDVKAMLAKRWAAAAVPSAIALICAIAVFVYGRMQRSDSLWMLTAMLTVVGGAYFIFCYGVYVRPAAIYRRHLTFMLGDRMRTTTGVFKFFSKDVTDHDGLECYSMLLNVGEKDDPEDDRLFYYDAYKPLPAFELGERVTVLSNDKMVSSMKSAC